QSALLEDMKPPDPTLWPQLVQTFRSSAAYHRQLEERRLAAQASTVNPIAAAPPPGSIRQTAYSDDRDLSPGAVLMQSFPTAADGSVVPPWPAAEFAAINPDAHLPELSLIKATRAEPIAAPTSPPVPADWHDQLQGAIRTFEAKLAADTQAGNRPAPATDQATLRMLYLTAGWRDDAVRPLAGVSEPDRMFWREELAGLATLLDDRRNTDAGRRALEAETHLGSAERTLAQMAPLVVRNPAFCTEVTSFGVIKPFAKYEFKPGQEVLL